jgi:hypothetical protein
MGWGSKQTTTSTNTSNNAYNQTNTPMQSAQVQGVNNMVLGQLPGLIQSANSPVYGDAQKASYMNSLNDLANAASKHLSSTLAGQGALQSGLNEQGQLGIQQNRLSNASNFFSQLPFAEKQAHLSNLSGALQTSQGIANSIPYATNASGTGQQTSQGSQTQTSSPGLGQLVGGLAGQFLGGITGGLGAGLQSGVGSMFGAGPSNAQGGGFGANFSSGYQNYNNPYSNYPGFNQAVPIQGPPQRP